MNSAAVCEPRDAEEFPYGSESEQRCEAGINESLHLAGRCLCVCLYANK